MDQQKLTSKIISEGDVYNVDAIFGKQRNLVVANIKYSMLGWKPYFFVPEGFYALVTNSGEDKDFNEHSYWPANLYWRFCSPLTSLVYDVPVKHVLTADNVKVKIDIQLVIRIMGDLDKDEDSELVRNFYYNLGVNNLNIQLSDTIDEEVRKLARALRHYEIFGLRRAYAMESGQIYIKDDPHLKDENEDLSEHEADDKAMLGSHDTDDVIKARFAEHNAVQCTEQLKQNLNENFNHLGVQIEDVVIENVQLPVDIFQNMTERTEFQSKNAEQRMNQKFEIQMTINEEEILKLKQKENEKCDKTSEKGKKAAVEVANRLRLVVAQSSIEIDGIQTACDVQQQLIAAKERLESSVAVVEKEYILTESKQRAEMVAAKTILEADLYKVTKGAESEYEVASNDASVTRQNAEGIGQATPLLRQREVVKNEEKFLSVMNSLTNNSDCIITGTDNKDTSAMMVCDKMLQPGYHGSNSKSMKSIAHIATLKASGRIIDTIGTAD